MTADFTEVKPEDRVIAVMGATGVGKSTFIAAVTGRGDEGVGHGLKPCTQRVRAVRIAHPSNEHNIVFVDTPGFDGISFSDTEILSSLATWLQDHHVQNIAGLIYLHRISDKRVNVAAKENAKMFENVCGKNARNSVVLATTMWGDVKEEVGVSREKQLNDGIWSGLRASGARNMRFDGTFESAWAIVNTTSLDTPAFAQKDRERREKSHKSQPWDWLSFGGYFLRNRKRG